MEHRSGSVGISRKDAVFLHAVAQGALAASREAVGAITKDGLPKSSPLAAEKTSDLIPHCHPAALSGITVEMMRGGGRRKRNGRGGGRGLFGGLARPPWVLRGAAQVPKLKRSVRHFREGCDS